MGRKKFEEVEYDPFEAEARRNLARQVAASSAAPAPTLEVEPEAQGSAVIAPKVVRRSETSSRMMPITSPVKGPQKSRTFKCANATQDKELDAFLVRLGEVAGTGVPFQLIARAAIAAAMRAEEQILDQIRRRPPGRRPATAAATQYAQFEQYWEEIVADALRKRRPYQS